MSICDAGGSICPARGDVGGPPGFTPTLAPAPGPTPTPAPTGAGLTPTPTPTPSGPGPGPAPPPTAAGPCEFTNTRFVYLPARRRGAFGAVPVAVVGAAVAGTGAALEAAGPGPGATPIGGPLLGRTPPTAQAGGVPGGPPADLEGEVDKGEVDKGVEAAADDDATEAVGEIEVETVDALAEAVFGGVGSDVLALVLVLAPAPAPDEGGGKLGGGTRPGERERISLSCGDTVRRLPAAAAPPTRLGVATTFITRLPASPQPLPPPPAPPPSPPSLGDVACAESPRAPLSGW